MPGKFNVAHAWDGVKKIRMHGVEEELAVGNDEVKEVKEMEETKAGEVRGTGRQKWRVVE